MRNLLPFTAILLSGASQTASPSPAGPMCSIPTHLPRPKPERFDASEVRRLPIGGYTLALSWSPEFCKSKRGDPRQATQCAAQTPFGFILHGLWPEGQGQSWPQYCGEAALLSDVQVRQNFCMTPSPQLMQHEWAKHGTCMAKDPARYFNAASTLYQSVPIPDMELLSREGVTVAEFKATMAARDKTLPASAINVKVNNGGWLQEVHICLDTRFQPQTCPGYLRRGDDRARLKIWRTAK